MALGEKEEILADDFLLGEGVVEHPLPSKKMGLEVHHWQNKKRLKNPIFNYLNHKKSDIE